MQQQNDAMSARWMTFQSAAKYLGVHIRTVENWEKLKCFKVARVIAPGKVKGRVLIDRISLDAYIEQFVGAAPQVIPMNTQANAKREAAKSGAAQ
jgi:hypothetical protein